MLKLVGMVVETNHLRLLPGLALALALSTRAAPPDVASQPANTWVKQTPLPATPVSPRLGYEGACVWDSTHRLVIRYGGHNQGGGGEQGSEVWTCDPIGWKWTLHEPNTSPPGVCCNAQNAFDPAEGRYIRFPSFSGSHGWQWWREIYLNDASVWTYDLASNTWRNMRPLPAPHVAPLRCASWDSDEQVVVVVGGEGGPRETLTYHPHRNEWRWMKPKSQPEPRSGGQMAYDTAHKVHVMFGSQFNNDPHTWIYDLRKNEWRDAKPAIMPPTDKNDAVLTYDPIRKVVVVIVKITTGTDDSAQHRLETWTYDAGANHWMKLNPKQEPDPSGNRARQLMFAPELGVALLENCPSKPREQQIWTLSPSPLNGPTPRRSEAAVLETGFGHAGGPTPRRSEAAVLETGFGHAGGERAGVRGETDRFVHAANPSAAPPLSGPRIVEDALLSVLSPTRVELTWKASEAKTVVGYHVERAAAEVLSEDQLARLKKQTPPLAEPSAGAIQRVGAFTRLTTAPVKTATFIDTNIDLTKPQSVTGEPAYERSFNREQFDESGRSYRFGVFVYRIRAVNAAGESGPSPALFTIPSAPQWLFSKEDGATCHLKWTANSEKALKGYRVYRMNGRYDKDPIPRLTSDPILATAYSDATAGKSSHRYYVVAVDALGQEGFPSAPVWFEREWKQFYKPFVGDWHQ